MIINFKIAGGLQRWFQTSGVLLKFRLIV